MTKSRFGDCTGERSFGADINFMEAEARLIKYRVDGSGTFVCAVKIDMATQSYAYGIDVTAGGRCGYGYYRADGWHSIDIGGVTHTGTSTSPSGYNS